ncbi:signal transduction histidine kinase [Nocardiopsis mwathae]|uniref:histidine kinase n=1 Tax=Nocardiopsis mwathae TaxID=1472723 RepID=A0A7W9YI21_9ACTN|nr:nitrate- and nitrite sensing domain-containing protein [Nocardiopsis mwathae]MBB6171581.1 signal transduction histidine kinase [Nocardiopsis mwathae]
MPTEQRRSLRSRLIALSLLPSAALLALWAVFTTVLVQDMLELRATAAFTEDVGAPVLDVIADLQAERRYTMEYIAGARAESRTPRYDTLARIRSQTDETVDGFRAAIDSGAPHPAATRVQSFDTTLDGLNDHRSALDEATPGRADAAAYYDGAIEDALRIWDAQAELVEGRLAHNTHSLTSLLRARELMAREDAILTYAHAADDWTTDDHAEFAAAVGAQRYLHTQITPDLSDSERAIFDGLVDSAFFRTVRALEDTVVAAAPERSTPVPVNAQSWKAAKEAVDIDFQKVEENRTEAVTTDIHGEATSLLWRAIALSTVSLVAVLTSLTVSLRFTRRLGFRMQNLREATLDYADTRLPTITARLRAGQNVDVKAEAPDIPVLRNDEIGQVTEAFNTAQRAAVTAAVEETRLRAGVRNLFRNVARRTQTLVHRQLGLLDTLEHSETDPDVLEALFRIDHLSTQLRRNAENLMLLTGGSTARPARRSDPVTLQDAARAASSEIEDYQRVRLLPMPGVSVQGDAGRDLVRLLAELLENATSFSPPHSSVTVRGESLANGHYALEVEDRGLGMPPERYERANALLAAPPDFDLADMREDSQLGLFVVATIAERHGLKVTLRPSPYNGTQAIVVLPPQTIADGAPATSGTRIDAARRPAPEAAPAAPRPPMGEPQGRPGADDGTAPSTDHTSPAADPTRPASPPLSPAPDASGAAPAPDAAGDGPPHPAPVAPTGDTYKGLPRRVRTSRRQGLSLPAPPTEAMTTEAADATRPLEEIRDMMSALQSGTREGRRSESGTGDDMTNTEESR